MTTLVQIPQNPPAPASRLSTGSLHKLAFPALGTTCEVQYASPGDGLPAVAFELAAVEWVRGGGDEETEDLFELCDNLHRMTQGVLDPTTLPLIRLWNWKAERPVIPAPDKIEAARRLTGWRKVQRSPGKVFLPEPGMALDFGGFGKEYAVDIVAQTALSHGLTNVLVDFGHDLRAIGAPPGRPAWHIGLEDPDHPGRISGSIAIKDKGVASSGDYVRCFKLDGRRYGHIIDPRTGWPAANGCTQATVIAGSCLQAGVLSTTAFVLGFKEGLDFIRSFPGVEGIIAGESRRAQTPGFFHHVVTS